MKYGTISYCFRFWNINAIYVLLQKEIKAIFLYKRFYNTLS